MLARPCLTCGQPTKRRGARCAAHGDTHGAPGRYTPAYARNAAMVISDARVRNLPCWLCGAPFKPGEKITAEHMVPKRHGGSDELDNLAPAHERCNYGRHARAC